jgi:transcriptional regulator of acetoin/glycerol metabolism
MRLALVLYFSKDQEPVMIENATVQWAMGTQFGVKFVKLSQNAEARLTNFFWTGIQQKCQSLLHLMTEAAKTSLLNDSIDSQIDTQATPLEDDQSGLIRRTLEECQWVIGGPSGAAVKLGMKRTSLQYRMKKLGITRTSLDRRR